MLNDLATFYETDKQSGEHNYTRAYEHYFEPIRHENLTILEIGFGMGNSGHMWEDYFPNAELHFVEIDPEAFAKNKKPFSSRCHFHLLDQGNKKKLTEFIQSVGKPFDIIIDDGSHQCAHQITSFEVLFPHVALGGWYVIEDLHTSYWRRFGGLGEIHSPINSASSAMQFLLERVHDLNHIGSYTGYADITRCSDGQLNNFSLYQKEIDSIHFHASMCFVKKRKRKQHKS